MTVFGHAAMSKKVREVLRENRGEPVRHLTIEVSRVVDRDYAVEEAANAAEHWKEVFLDGTTPHGSKDTQLDACRERHRLWMGVVDLKTFRF